jgi:hypothetical protein
MPSFKQNLAELKGYGRTAPKENKAKIEEIIDLYERKKIPNFRTAENAVIRLNQKSKNAARSKRAELEYEKVVAKYRDAQPITGRLNRELDKKRKSSEILAGITMILFRVKDRSGEKQEVTVNVDGVGGEGAKQDMREIGKKVKNELTNKNNKTRRKCGDLEQFYIGTFDLRIDKLDLDFLKKVENQMMRRGGTAEGSDFKRLAQLLMSKNVAFSHLMDSTGKSYLEAIYVMDVFDSGFKDSNRVEFDPKKRKNKDTEKVAAYYRYTSTELDLSAGTFKEAIAKQNYVKNECFINSLYDFYRDSLLSTNKKRNVITRETILKDLRKTEEDVKEGLSIEDVRPFFEKHRLQLRVFDKFYKLLFKYDPPNRNHHNKAMYCMAADGHIYTLNHCQSRIEQKQDKEDDELEINLAVGENFVIREEAEATPAKMITDVNDLLRVVREQGEGGDGKKFLKLVHREDNLTDLLYQLLDAGYSPGVNFEAGRITGLKLELNKVFVIIETQQLIKSAIDGVVAVEDEETYNNMNQAMTAMNSKLFLKSHLSFYTEQDVDILDAYRTKPICGNLLKSNNSKNLIEIDLSKAYTAAFSEISEVPIFNEFDAFKPYRGEAIQELSLYLVKNGEHLRSPEAVSISLHPLNTQSHSLENGRAHD